MHTARAVAQRDTPFKELARLIDAHDVDTIPVVDEFGRLVGIITASDLLVRLAGTRIASWENRLAQWAVAHRKIHAPTANALMSYPALTVGPDTPVVEAGRLAARTGAHTLGVVDELGTLIGMITRRDLVRIYLRPDEEILQAACAATDAGRRGITVCVDEGVVALAGPVADQLDARDLVARARQVLGTVDVVNHLRVREPVHPGLCAG
jgi:CBS domain-containing protein